MKIHSRSLAGRKILITRPERQSVKLCQMIESLQGIPITFPTIDIQPIELAADAPAKERMLRDVVIAIFISSNAVIHAQRSFPQLIEYLQDKPVIAAGQGTAERLAAIGLYHAVYAEEEGGSEALAGLPVLSQVKDKHILIVRGEGGREWLKDKLTSKGARVRYLEVYRRKKPDVSQAQMERIWHHGELDAVVITSREGLTNLLELIPAAEHTALHKTTLVVMSDRIGRYAVNLGFNRIVVALENHDAALVDALMRLNGN